MAKRPSIKSLIKDLAAEELREVIAELCKLSTKNRQFLELYLQGSDTAQPEPIVEEAKKAIYRHLYGRGQFPKLDLRAARKAVTEYSKVLKEYPRHAAELKLYYVELGTQITDDYGDLYEGFYNSMASMFESFCSDVKRHPMWYPDFADRMRALEQAAYDMGWGYGDDVSFLMRELQEHVEQNTTE